MIGTPANANSVHVPTIQAGCMKVEFDSTYPVRLNGIINQDEFQQSIHKINRTISLNTLIIVVVAIFGLFVIGGMICFVAGVITLSRPHSSSFVLLLGVGVAMTIFGSLIFVVGCCMIQSQRSEHMRRAIAEESAKYTSRSSVSCSWRLNVTRGLMGTAYAYNHHAQLLYHIVIDVGRAGVGDSGNAVYYANAMAATPNVFFSQPTNYAPPPPPYSSPTPEVCAQCGVPQQNPTAKFCSSCGQMFTKY